MMKTKEEIEKMSLQEFILFVDYMTTKDFCDWQGCPHPRFIANNIEASADQLLQVDAIKHRLFVQKAKDQARNPKKVELKFQIAFPVPVGVQSETEAWMNPKKWSSKEIISSDPVVFIEPCSVAGVFANKVYFLKDTATYWHYVTGIFKLTDAKYH